MNKDQVIGTAKDVVGQAQEKLGDVTGSTGQRAKGLVKQVEGHAQKMIGDVKEVLKDAADKA